MKHWSLIATLVALVATLTVALAPAPAAADDTEAALWTAAALAGLGIGYTWYVNAPDSDKAKIDELIEKGKDYLADWVIAGGNASLLDPNVQASLLTGDYDTALDLALPIVLNTVRNEATAAVSDPAVVNAAVQAAWRVVQEDELLAAMISRPGGEGLYWRYLAWRTAHGYTVKPDEVFVVWPNGEDLYDLLHLIAPAVIEEYHAATEYLAAAIRENEDYLPISAEPEGLDTGAEVW